MRYFFLLLAFCATTSLAQAQKGKTEALTSIGAISGLMLYNTYLSIGAVADGFAKDVYDSDYVSDLMEEQVASMDLQVETYNKLLDSGFLTDASDVDYVEEIAKACKLLKAQAKALKKFAETNADRDADTFQEKRTDAWDKIAELLKLE